MNQHGERKERKELVSGLLLWFLTQNEPFFQCLESFRWPVSIMHGSDGLGNQNARL